MFAYKQKLIINEETLPSIHKHIHTTTLLFIVLHQHIRVSHAHVVETYKNINFYLKKIQFS